MNSTRPGRPVWNRSIVALLVSVFSTASASLLATTSLGKQVYDLTHRPLDLGLLGLAEFAPSALLVLVTGAVADRFPRTRVAAASAALQAAAGSGLAALAAVHVRRVFPIFALVLVFGVGQAFLAPAARALPADVAPPPDLPWLVARRAAAWQVAIIAGPVAAGFLYAAAVPLPYLVMCSLLLLAVAALFAVRPLESALPSALATPNATPPPSVMVAGVAEPSLDPVEGHGPPVRAGLREALEGLRFIRGSPLLFGAISLDLFAVLFGGAVALLPAIATDRLHVGAVGLGWLRAAGGIGAAATTLGLARRPLRRHVGRSLLGVVALFGMFTILLGSTHSFALAFTSMALLSGADAVSVFIRSTLVPLVAPPERRGRVLAVESVFIGASNELGAFESGVAGQLLGSAGAVVFGGAATLVVAAIYWFAFPALRELDAFPGSRGHSGS